MSLIRDNLMTRKGYSPYCGGQCRTMPRTKFDGQQFNCPRCGWKSNFPNEFIDTYKREWGLTETSDEQVWNMFDD